MVMLLVLLLVLPKECGDLIISKSIISNSMEPLIEKNLLYLLGGLLIEPEPVLAEPLVLP